MAKKVNKVGKGKRAKKETKAPTTLIELRKLESKKQLKGIAKREKMAKEMEKMREQVKKNVMEEEMTKAELMRRERQKLKNVEDIRKANIDLPFNEFKKLLKRDYKIDFEGEQDPKEAMTDAEINELIAGKSRIQQLKQASATAEEETKRRETARKQQLVAEEAMRVAEEEKKMRLAKEKQAKNRISAVKQKINGYEGKLMKYEDEIAKKALSPSQRKLKEEQIAKAKQNILESQAEIETIRSSLGILPKEKKPKKKVIITKKKAQAQQAEEAPAEQDDLPEVLAQAVQQQPQVVVQQPEEQNAQQAEDDAEEPPEAIQQLNAQASGQIADEHAEGLKRNPIIGLGLAKRYGIHPNHIKEGKNSYIFTKRGKEHVKALTKLLHPHHLRYVINWSILNKVRNDKTKPNPKNMKAGSFDLLDRLKYWIGSTFTPLGLLTKNKSYDQWKSEQDAYKARRANY